MADGYDNDNSGGGSFVMGLLTGTVLGAGLGMLFAPKAGAELRNQVMEQAGNLANTASDGYRRASETATQYAERGREMAGDIAGRARDAVAKGAEEAQRYVRDTTGGTDIPDRMATASSTGAGTQGSTGLGSGTGSGSSTGPRPAGTYSGGSQTGPTHSGSGGTGGSRG
jgi:gas vesicle protein